MQPLERFVDAVSLLVHAPDPEAMARQAGLEYTFRPEWPAGADFELMLRAPDAPGVAWIRVYAATAARPASYPAELPWIAMHAVTLVEFELAGQSMRLVEWFAARSLASVFAELRTVHERDGWVWFAVPQEVLPTDPGLKGLMTLRRGEETRAVTYAAIAGSEAVSLQERPIRQRDVAADN